MMSDTQCFELAWKEYNDQYAWRNLIPCDELNPRQQSLILKRAQQIKHNLGA